MRIRSDKTAARFSLFFIGLIIAVPSSVYYHSPPLLSFYTDWLAFFFGISACAALLFRENRDVAAIPRIVMAPAVLIVTIGVQVAIQDVYYFEPSIQAVLYLIWAVALIWVGSALRETLGWEEVCSVLAWFFVVGGMIGAIAALLQHYQWHTFLDPVIARKIGNGVQGNFAQANHFANYTASSLVSALYLVARKKFAGLAALPVVLLLLFVLALTGSRSGWLYLVGFFILSLLFYRQNRRSDFRILIVCTVLLLPAYMVWQVLSQTAWFAPVATTILTPNDRLFAEVSGSSARFEIWEAAWKIFMHSPLIGAGFQNFGWEYFQLSNQLHNNIHGLPANAHNLIMQLLATTGLLGTLGVLGALIGWCRNSTVLTKEPEHWWLWALLMVIAIHSALEFPLWYANFLGVTAVLFGLGDCRIPWVTLRKRSIVVLFVAVGYIIAVDTLVHYAKMEWWLNIYKLGPNDSLARQQDQALLQLRQSSLFAPTLDAMFANIIEPGKEQASEKLAFNSRVMHFSPGEQVVYRQVLLMTLNNQPMLAAEQLDRAATVFPGALPDFAQKVKALKEVDGQTFSGLWEQVSAELAKRSLAK